MPLRLRIRPHLRSNNFVGDATRSVALGLCQASIIRLDANPYRVGSADYSESGCRVSCDEDAKQIAVRLPLTKPAWPFCATSAVKNTSQHAVNNDCTPIFAILIPRVCHFLSELSVSAGQATLQRETAGGLIGLPAVGEVSRWICVADRCTFSYKYTTWPVRCDSSAAVNTR